MWRNEQTEALQVLADVYLDQGLADRAAVLLEALTVLEPDNLQTFKALGYAQLEAGDYEAALAAVDALLRLGAPMPENAPALLLRSKALWAMGRVAEAQENLQRYLELESPA